MAKSRRGTTKQHDASADRNLKDQLHPDRARSDELGHEAPEDVAPEDVAPEPGPRELPARAVHPEGRPASEDE